MKRFTAWIVHWQTNSLNILLNKLWMFSPKYKIQTETSDLVCAQNFCRKCHRKRTRYWVCSMSIPDFYTHTHISVQNTMGTLTESLFISAELQIWISVLPARLRLKHVIISTRCTYHTPRMIYAHFLFQKKLVVVVCLWWWTEYPVHWLQSKYRLVEYFIFFKK